MRLLHLDIDTLRPDHLGCYGYERATSTNIDALAREGWLATEMYVSDTPCLPSRSALLTGRFGITNGVVNHGGARAEPFAEGAGRGLQSELARTSFPRALRDAGLWCATISTFAERHSAFHWYAGFNESFNLGTNGRERAEEVATAAHDWLQRHGKRDDWYLHVHFWDPHTPYRTPLDWGNPFADDGARWWIDDDVIAAHRELAGPHSAQEVMGFGPDARFADFPRQPQEIASPADVRAMFDGYDVAVRYTDAHVGWLLDSLAELGVLDETTVVVSSDHGENLGELGIYCDHQTADLITHRVPAVVRGPGIPGGRVDDQLRYQLDLSATLVELAGGTVPAGWDGRSFCGELTGDGQTGERRDHLVLSCGAWATQRAVRFDDWLSIRTHHDAFHGFPTTMLFDVVADPHEQHDVADAHPDVVGRAAQLLLDWESAAMERSPSPVDPLATVLREGGGYYTRGQLDRYLQRLVATGRDEWAARLATSMTAPSMAAPSIAAPAADGAPDWAAAPTD